MNLRNQYWPFIVDPSDKIIDLGARNSKLFEDVGKVDVADITKNWEELFKVVIDLNNS